MRLSLGRLGLLIAAGCLALSGCAHGLAAGDPPPDAPAPDADPDEVLIASVDTTLAADSFALSTSADLSVGPNQFHLTASGSADYPKLIADMTVLIESGTERGELEVRSDGTTVWMRTEGDAATELGLPEDKSWVEGDATRLTDAGSTFDQSGLLGVVLTLRASDAAETIGTDTRDGVDVTRYRTSVTYEDAVEAAGPDADALEQALSLDAPTPIDLDIEVAVGSDGVIRDFSLTADAEAGIIGLTADYQVSLSEVGQEVDLPQPPPRDQTVTGREAERILDEISG